jgi:RHS repeat-associated protein
MIGRVIANPLPVTPTVGEQEYTLPGLTGSDYDELTYTLKWEELDDALTPVGGSTPALRVIGSEYLPTPGSLPGSGNFPATQSTSYERLFQSSVPSDDDEEHPNVATLVVGHNQSASQLFNPVVLTAIDLPDGTKYEFSYNVYGQIDKVVYPTGAYEKYTHTGGPTTASYITELEGDQQPYLQGLRWISSRKVSENGTGSDELEWTYDNGPQLDGGGNTDIINPDGTKVSIERSGPGDKYYDSVGNRYYYRFGNKDPRVGMTLSKTFYSAPVSSVRTMLRRELYAYDAHDSHSTEYSVTCQLGQSSTTKYFPMRRAARLARQTNIIFEGSGDALAQSTVYSYDTTYEMTTGLDQTYTAVYDYVVLSSSTAQTATIGSISLETRLKYSETTYNNGYQSSNILGLPATVTVKNNDGTVLSRSEMAYDECTAYCAASGAALPTTQKSWDSTKGAFTSSSAYLATHAKFDSYGNRIEATDAKGYVTTTAYDTTYHAYPVSVTMAVADSYGTYGSSSAFTISTTYDPISGLILSTTDINGQSSSMEYEDPALRPTKVTAPNGHQTITEYGAGSSESTRWVKVRMQVNDSAWKEARTWYDGLGRIYKTEKTDSGGNLFTETEYDDMGRVKRMTGSYRDGETKQWTTPTYDDLSRTEKVTSSDSNEINVAFGLSTSGVIGTTKTITDQAGKKRKGIIDALGNMVRVIEDPDSQNLATDYVFDLLGNLRKTTQGDQVRYFSYDSLGRLLRAKQVEQVVNSSLAMASADPVTSNNAWTVKYEYDDNGNITSTTDAKNVTVTATYDRLSRLVSRDYSDSTPDVTFYYDGKGLGSVPDYSKGKLTKITNGVSENKYTSFDVMGLMLASQQITDGQTYSFGYTYNLAGAMIEESYPSGRVVKNTLDENGDISQVQSKKNSGSGYWTYADAIDRNSVGAITKMQLGNGHWETATYNERQQVIQRGLGKLNNTNDLLNLEFKYHTGTSNHDNNGAVLEQKITVPTVGGSGGFAATQTYAYDSLNRVQSATETISSTQTWKQTFSYDRYGNRRFNTTSGATTTLGSCDPVVCNPTISTSTNRINDSYYVYDANGNLIEDPNASEFAYDAENRQKEVKDDEDTVKGTYFYDGNGKRVKKIASAETTVFVYDANGQLAAEYSTVLASTPQVSYLTADHLGSPRVITNENGAVVNRKDFSAFGEETLSSQRTVALGYTDAAARNVRQDYTGYQKDTESGLEYAQARYYNAQQGRFTSVDPMTGSGTIRNPQSFNRYSYVLNSPYKFTDPLGLFPSGGGGCGHNRCRRLVYSARLPLLGADGKPATTQVRDTGAHRAADNSAHEGVHVLPAQEPPKPADKNASSDESTGSGANSDSQQTDKKDPPPRPAYATVTIEKEGGNREFILPDGKTVVSGTFIILKVTLFDKDGKPITGASGFEYPRVITGPPVVRNEELIIFDSSGSSNDIVGQAAMTDAQLPFAVYNAIILNNVTTPHQSDTEQILRITVPGIDEVFTVTFRRGYTNMDGGTIRPSPNPRSIKDSYNWTFYMTNPILTSQTL